MIIKTKDSSQFGLKLEARMSVTGIPGAETTSAFHDTTTTVVAQTSASRIYEVVDPYPGVSQLELTNETPSVCSIANWPLVEPVSSGVGSVLINRAGGVPRSRMMFDFTDRPAETLVYASGAEADSYFAYSYALLNPLLGNTDLNLFTGTPTAGVLNPNCWAAGFDFTGVSVWNSFSGTAHRPATAITRRHVAMVWHYRLRIGDTVKFADGTDVHTRTIIGINRDTQNWTYHSNWVIGDRCVAVLDSPLPETVASYPVLGDWFYQKKGETVFGSDFYYAFCGLVLNLARQVGGFMIPTTRLLRSDLWTNIFNGSGNVNGVAVLNDPCVVDSFCGYSHATYLNVPAGGFIDTFVNHRVVVVEGHSGSPTFAPVDGGLALYSTFTTYKSGPRWDATLTNLLIADADADAIARGNLTEPTGLTVSVAPSPVA